LVAFPFFGARGHESANIVLMEDNLWKLIQMVEISRVGVLRY